MSSSAISDLVAREFDAQCNLGLIALLPMGINVLECDSLTIMDTSSKCFSLVQRASYIQVSMYDFNCLILVSLYLQILHLSQIHSKMARYIASYLYINILCCQ